MVYLKIKELMRQYLCVVDEELRELNFFSGLNLESRTVYDIGSSHGRFTVLFAKAVKPLGKVVAFEPNPEVFDLLKRKLEECEFVNVLAYNIGIGAKNGREKLIVRQNDTGTGSMECNIKKKIINERDYKEYDVDIKRLDTCLEQYCLPKPDFIKIDVEGMEYECLLGMQSIMEKYRPKLFIEIHGSDFKRKEENVIMIVRFLKKQGYSLHHFESRRKISLNNANLAREGHLFCQQKRRGIR